MKAEYNTDLYITDVITMWNCDIGKWYVFRVITVIGAKVEQPDVLQHNGPEDCQTESACGSRARVLLRVLGSS